MSNAADLFANAVVQHREGAVALAEASLRKAIDIDPTYAPALHLRGVIAFETGQMQAAFEWFEQATNAQTANAHYWSCLGAACLALRQIDAAEAHHRKADRLAPGDPFVLNNLGIALATTGRAAEAVQVLLRALKAAPGDAEILCNLAGALHGSGRQDEALIACRDALRRNPALAQAHQNLGNLLRDSGDLTGAEASFRAAERFRPGWASASYSLGSTLQAQGRLVEAQALYRVAMATDPEDYTAHGTLAGSLFYDPTAGAEQILAEHRRWAERHAPKRLKPHSNLPDPSRRLRIGYVSADFRNHAVAFFLQPVLANHDPRDFEVVCYSGVARPDSRSLELRQLAHVWRDIVAVSDTELAALIRQDGIDILVDLAGHMAGGRLRAFAERPAPIQVSYLGYPGTTGLTAIDYRITDSYADLPGAQFGYSEQLVALPGCFCCYAPPAFATPQPTPPSSSLGFVTFGSLHKLEKLNDHVLDLWSTILRDNPTSRLLLARNTLRGALASEWHKRFEQRGIQGDRIVVEAVEAVDMAHLRLLDRVDVALDPFPWGGHTTACEALWMGVPTVTLLGSSYAGRMVASILQAVGLSDLIAGSPDAYRRIAQQIASDHNRRALLRTGLREKMLGSPLCDGPTFTRGLEVAFRRMWHDWCASSERSLTRNTMSAKR